MPQRVNPGRQGATKESAADLRKLRKADQRTLQLRYLCAGARGAAPGLFWSNTDRWGNELEPAGTMILTVDATDPSQVRTESLEPWDRVDPYRTPSESEEDD